MCWGTFVNLYNAEKDWETMAEEGKGKKKKQGGISEASAC